MDFCLSKVPGYPPGTECKACRGRCCRERGCSLAPEDLQRMLGDKKVTLENVEALLKDPEKGMLAIDRFSGQKGPVYFLRMKHKCYTFIGVDAIGECVALTENGCSLSMEERPKGGRFLKSHPGGNCIQEYTAGMMEEDWRGYREILKELWNRYEEQFVKDGTFDACDEAYFDYLRHLKR